MKPTLYLFVIAITVQMSLGVSPGWAEGATEPIRLVNTQVTLPISTARFPQWPGVEIANAYCTMCHSADMVTQQPPSLTRKDWQAEVHKMQATYGAPIPDDQIPPLATYLAATVSENHSRNACY